MVNCQAVMKLAGTPQIAEFNPKSKETYSKIWRECVLAPQPAEWFSRCPYKDTCPYCEGLKKHIKAQEQLEEAREHDHDSKEAYLVYYYANEVKVQKGLLTPYDWSGWSDQRGSATGSFIPEGASSLKPKCPLRPLEFSQRSGSGNKIICFDEKDIPKATEMVRTRIIENKRARDAKNDTLVCLKRELKQLSEDLKSCAGDNEGVLQIADKLFQLSE